MSMIAWVLLLLVNWLGRSEGAEKDTGYRGIWFTLGQVTEYGDKYSGGLGTYTANHVPIAIYCPKVEKTFFVYGGARDGKRHLLNMISFYDHKRKVVPRPVTVHDKGGVDDPHDNAALAIDGQGFLWVFISGRMRIRPGFIYKSREPFSIEAFELVREGELTYPQPWWFPEVGFFFLFTKYTQGRELYFNRSPDGFTWRDDTKFAGMGGHYQTSGCRGNTVFTAFNYHPGGNVDRRTNLYFLQSRDYGQTWQNVLGETVEIPLTEPVNAALVRHYEAEGRLVYIHDVDLDDHGHPVILYITSNSYKPGPEGDPRWWTVAHWNGSSWEYSELTPANHNYSTGSLYLESSEWWVIGPTEPGPQPVGAGGEIAIWVSSDKGRSWQKKSLLTSRSAFNHNYVRRPVGAHPEFFAFWADGNPDTFSPSYLYFYDRQNHQVFRLPYHMTNDEATPEPVVICDDLPTSNQPVNGQ